MTAVLMKPVYKIFFLTLDANGNDVSKYQINLANR